MYKTNSYWFFFTKKEDDDDDADETAEAPWLGKKVRVEVEDMSLNQMFGETGVVIAASLKDKS